MRIGLLSPSIYMSPVSFGDMIFAPRDLSVALADGLTEKGHEVYFFTAPDIKTKANLVVGDADLLRRNLIEEKLKGKSSERLKWASFYNIKKYYEIDLVEKCYKMALEGKLDIIHSYHDFLAHFFNDQTGFPTVYTLHDPVPCDENTLSYWLLNRFKYQNYVSISKAFEKFGSIHVNFIDTVYHGINISDYKFFPQSSEYIGFIGRMEKQKGVDLAIEAAKLVDKQIKIATSPPDQYQNLPYYKEMIMPRLNPNVSFTGFLSSEKKHEFLGNALCLLFPIQWEEPFGMVMIEAMACGTPVVAFNRGSVSEIVRDGVTGFVVDPAKGVAGLVEAIQRIGEIDRKNCRKHVEENFTVEKMADGYEKVYQKVLASKGQALRS